MAEEDLTETLDTVLGFYGIQLQSHAGLMVGLVVGFFNVVQLWVTVRPASSVFLAFLSLVMGLSGWGVVYCLLRLWVYGKFTTAILNGNAEEFRNACSSSRGLLRQ